MNSESAPVPTGSPTEKLRSTLERHVHDVVEEAMTRATAIEERANAKAAEIEREAHRKAADVLEDSRRQASDTLQSSIDRTDGVLGAIETSGRSSEAAADLLAGVLTTWLATRPNPA